MTCGPAPDLGTQAPAGVSDRGVVVLEAVAVPVEREGNLHGVFTPPFHVLGEDDVSEAVTVHIAHIHLGRTGEPLELDGHVEDGGLILEGNQPGVLVALSPEDPDLVVLTHPGIVLDLEHVLDAITVEVVEAALLSVLGLAGQLDCLGLSEFESGGVAGGCRVAASGGEHHGRCGEQGDDSIHFLLLLSQNGRTQLI